MNANEIYISARRILQDTIEPYRWSNDELKSHLQDALQHLNSIRPETRYVDGVLCDGITLPLSPTDEISVGFKFKEALVYYVVSKCYLDDSSDTVNAQLSETFLAKANSKMQL